MARWVSVMLLGVGLSACVGEDEYDPSSPTDPTADFDVNAPDVDTERPDTDTDTGDTAYPGSRRRTLDTGWRLRQDP